MRNESIDYGNFATFLLFFSFANFEVGDIFRQLFAPHKTRFVQAEPRAFGTIPARGVSCCLLTLRRAPEMNNWKDVKSASVIMITEFEGSDDPNINEHTVTKIKCMMVLVQSN